MFYQIAINLYGSLNANTVTPITEQIRLYEQMVFTRRQVMFELHRNNKSKIGMNTIENKFYYVNKLIV